MGDGHIFQSYVEFGSTFQEIGPDTCADCFSLGNKFRSIELSDNSFEDFVTDGRKDTLIIVKTEGLWFGISVLCLKIARALLGRSIKRREYKPGISLAAS